MEPDLNELNKFILNSINDSIHHSNDIGNSEYETRVTRQLRFELLTSQVILLMMISNNLALYFNKITSNKPVIQAIPFPSLDDIINPQ